VADLQKTVEIVFGGRNELSKIIGDVDRSLGSLNDASQPFADMADNVLKAEAGVIALGTAVAGLSIAKAGEFSDQFAEITTLIDESAGSLGGYRQEILDYATDSTQSLDNINSAVYSAISAGIDYTDALGVMTDAEQLAVAGKADLESTLVALASTLNTYGASADEAADYSDVLFTTVKQGQTTIPELAASLSQVTPTASAAGVEFDELSAAIAALTASGMETSTTTTSLKAALSNIIKPSADAKKAAEELGIEFSATALETQGLGDFMQMLYDATGGNIETMGRLFGSTEALNAVMVLAADSSGTFAETLALMEDRAGATATAFEKMANKISLQNQKVINNLDIVLVKGGTKLLDEYGDVIDALIANLQGIGTAIDKGDLDGLIGIFESAMGDITKLLQGVAKVLPEALAGIKWDSLESSFNNLKESLGGAFDTLFGDLDITSVEGLQDAIQTTADLLAGLTNTASGVVDGLKPLFVTLGELADQFANAGESGQEFAGEILGMGKSINVLTGFAGEATDAVAGLGQGLTVLGGAQLVKTLKSLGSGAGLAGTLGTVTTAAKTLTPVLGAVGLAAALGTLAYKAGEALAPMKESERIMRSTAPIASELARTQGLVAQKLGEISDATGINITSMEDFNRLQEEGVLVYNDLNGEWERAVDAQGKLKVSVSEASEQMSKQQENAHELEIRLAELTSKEHIVEIETQAKIDIAEIESETERVIAALELRGLQTQETTKRIEAMYDFRADAVVAEAEKIESAFEAVSDSIGSISGAFGDFTGILTSENADWTDKMNAEGWIDEAMRQQEKLVNAQVRLTNTQSRLAELKYEKLSSGEGLIKIESDGLEPALEQVLWSIMEKVQLKVSMEQAELLLGLDAEVTT
jgi:TP901 family phage tail tape measure protein